MSTFLECDLRFGLGGIIITPKHRHKTAKSGWEVWGTIITSLKRANESADTIQIVMIAFKRDMRRYLLGNVDLKRKLFKSQQENFLIFNFSYNQVFSG